MKSKHVFFLFQLDSKPVLNYSLLVNYLYFTVNIYNNVFDYKYAYNI